MSAVPDHVSAGPARSQPETSSAEDLVAVLFRPAAGTALLQVAGEVDSLTAPVLDEALDRLLAEPAGTLVVDLSGVTFLASSGLAVLIRAQRVADERARTLRVVTATRAVLRVLEVTGADQLFVIHPTADDALAVSD